MMKNLLKLFFVFMLVTSCTEDDALMETKNTNTNYKTAETQKVSALLEEKQKSSSWFTPHLSYSESIALNHTDAEITAYPVTSVLTNAYSRLFSLEVDGETRLAIYHMLPSEASTSEHFYGTVIVSNMEGKVFRGFKVEANEFISMYDFESLKHDYYVIDFLQSEGKCDEDECPFSSCNLCGELDEVIIPIPPDSEPDVPVVLPPGDGGGGGPPSGDPLPNLPGGGGGGANDGSCPPGEIKDELGNCVEPPEDGGVYIIGECPEEDDDGLSMAGVCLELVEENPCDKLNNLATDTTFINKLQELEENTSLDYETGFLLNHNGTDYDPISGEPGDDFIDFDVSGTIDGLLHSHVLPNGHSMFSPDDIRALFILLENGNINNTGTFVMSVITGHRTSYTIIINNENAFNSFGQSNLSNQTNFNSFSNYYSNNYLANLTVGLDDIIAREVAMLIALEDSGLSLLNGNSDYSDWQKIETQNRQTIEVDCN